MRQFFTTEPYVPPPDPDPVIALMRRHGTLRRVLLDSRQAFVLVDVTATLK